MGDPEEPETGQRPPRQPGSAARPAHGPDPSDHGHLLCPYETDQNFVDTVTGFLVPALEEGQAAIVVTTHRRVGAIEAALGDHGLDVEGAKRTEQLTLLDAATLLATLPADATLPDRAYTMLLQTVAQTATAGRQIRLVSELGALLWQRGQHRAAMALEAASTQFAAAWPLTLLCPYPRPKPSGGQRAACGFKAIDADTPASSLANRSDSRRPANDLAKRGEMIRPASSNHPE